MIALVNRYRPVCISLDQIQPLMLLIPLLVRFDAHQASATGDSTRPKLPRENQTWSRPIPHAAVHVSRHPQ